MTGPGLAIANGVGGLFEQITGVFVGTIRVLIP